jgi:hypothetical protein
MSQVARSPSHKAGARGTLATMTGHDQTSRTDRVVKGFQVKIFDVL